VAVTSIPCFQASGWASSQPSRSAALRPSNRSTARRRPTSTTADTHRVDAPGVALRNDVSSTPSISTPAVRAGSSTSGVPYTVTADMAAHHEQPSSPATDDTGRARRPTCWQAHNPARRVS
jgi:hypothetical protein